MTGRGISQANKSSFLTWKVKQIKRSERKIYCSFFCQTSYCLFIKVKKLARKLKRVFILDRQGCIRTSVIRCLSSGMTKNNKIMPMFVLFSRLFWLLAILKVLLFFSKIEGQSLHQNSQTGCSSQFLKGTTMKCQFFQEREAILTKKWEQT